MRVHLANKYHRTNVPEEWLSTDAEESLETVIFKKNNKNHVYEVHESIVDKIVSFVPSDDLISFKVTCGLMNQFIEHKYILERMNYEMGPGYTFARCVFTNNIRYTDIMLKEKMVEQHYINKGFLYAMFTRRTEVAYLLFHHLHVTKSNTIRPIQLCDHSVHCHKSTCFLEYMHDNVYDMNGNNVFQTITSKELLGMACAAGDVDMVITIANKFGMKLGRDELDTAVCEGSIHVLEFLCSTKHLKINLNCISYLITTVYEHYKWHVLEYILQKGYVKLNKRLIFNLVECAKTCSCEACNVNYILHQYATQKMLNRALIEYVYNLQLPAIEDLMLRSSRVHIQPRIFRIIDSWDNFKLLRLENILYNRYILNQRRN